MMAPDFTLADLRSEQAIHFSALRGERPAVLLFGSFGCNLFCGQVDRLRKLYQAHHHEAVFLFVVIKNGPHAPPAALQQAFEKAGLAGDEEAGHCSRARLGLQVLDLPFPAVVDTPDQKVEGLYDAYPERLVIVGGDGRIVLDAGRGMTPGPHEPGWDFDAIEAALRGLLRHPDAARS